MTTVGLAIVGVALVTLSWGACGTTLSDERLSPHLTVMFLGGLIGGGAALAAAVIRMCHPRTADAEMDVAPGMGVAGVSLAIGAGALELIISFTGMGEPPLGAAFVLGAAFTLGVALTIGALGLLAWAANGPHSTR